MPYLETQISPCGKYRRVSATVSGDLFHMDTKARRISLTFNTEEYGECTIEATGDRYSALMREMRHGDKSAPETVVKHLLAFPL
jgi:hypothetical protein